MKEKGNTGHLIAVIVLSVLLVLGLALCGWMVTKTRTRTLSQIKEPVDMEDVLKPKNAFASDPSQTGGEGEEE